MDSRKTGLLICLLVCGISIAGATAGSEADTRDGVFVHVSSDDPHQVLMALKMANVMASDHDVLVYFDIKGVELLLEDAEDVAFSHFPSSKEQLASLVEGGVTVMACPDCLKVAGKTEDDLAEGIQLANKEKFFSFTQGRILTLDY